MTLQDIVLNDRAWYAENNIRLHLDKKVTRIDRRNRKVIAEDGTEEPYDRLLLATGSEPYMPPLAGCDLRGVLSFAAAYTMTYVGQRVVMDLRAQMFAKLLSISDTPT